MKYFFQIKKLFEIDRVIGTICKISLRINILAFRLCFLVVLTNLQKIKERLISLLQQIDGKQRTVACRLATHVYLPALFSLLPSEMDLEISVLMLECIFQKIFFLMKTSVFL